MAFLSILLGAQLDILGDARSLSKTDLEYLFAED